MASYVEAPSLPTMLWRVSAKARPPAVAVPAQPQRRQTGPGAADIICQGTFAIRQAAWLGHQRQRLT